MHLKFSIFTQSMQQLLELFAYLSRIRIFNIAASYKPVTMCVRVRTQCLKNRGEGYILYMVVLALKAFFNIYIYFPV